MNAGLGVPHQNVEDRAKRDERTPLSRVPEMALRVRFGQFELDEDNALLLRDGTPLALPPRPFEVLCALARRPGALVTKNALLDEVWGHRFVSESVLKTVVGKLRIALQDDARNPRFIETVARRGYRFIATEEMARGDPPAGSSIGHRPAQGLPPRLDAAGVAAEGVLREIREMLLLLIEQPHERSRAAARIVDYIAHWAPKTASEGR